MSEADGEMDASGVEASEGVSLEEAAGELAGGVDDEVEGPLAPEEVEGPLAPALIKSVPTYYYKIPYCRVNC